MSLDLSNITITDGGAHNFASALESNTVSS